MRARLPWLLLGAWALMTAAVVTANLVEGDVLDAVIAPALAVLAGVGAVLAARRRENPIGWLLLVLALLIAVSGLAETVYVGYEDDPSPPLLPRLLLWLDTWVFFVYLAIVGILVPLLFPDGRLPSRRWRGLTWAGLGVIAAAIVGTAFGSERLDWGEEGTLPNPLAVGGTLGEILRVVAKAGAVPFAVVLLGALAGVAVRLRRSSGVERQQLKWFASSIGLLVLGLVGAALSETTGYVPLGNVGWAVFLLSLTVAMPLAIGVAILRHRLYDIDVVLNRALVYGALTITLAAAYLGLVLLVGLAVGKSDLTIAGSTLAVAALFRPARARIQAAVDQRFYRRRYDAARTLEGFSARLRDELDLEALGADLSGVVRDTVQPAHVSLWLRGER